MKLMCPHCGWIYDTDTLGIRELSLMPTHVFPELSCIVCPGSEQHPRNPESDKRPLWKDEEKRLEVAAVPLRRRPTMSAEGTVNE